MASLVFCPSLSVKCTVCPFLAVRRPFDKKCAFSKISRIFLRTPSSPIVSSSISGKRASRLAPIILSAYISNRGSHRGFILEQDFTENE